MKPAECDELKPYFEEAWELSAAAEREACAKVCEAMTGDVFRLANFGAPGFVQTDLAEGTNAIEVRGIK